MDKEGYPICPECGGHGTIRLYRYEDDLSPEGEEEEEDNENTHKKWQVS